LKMSLYLYALQELWKWVYICIHCRNFENESIFVCTAGTLKWIYDIQLIFTLGLRWR
jgi:hypothetical protein